MAKSKINKTTKLTLSDLIAKKEQKEKARIAFKDIYVPSLDGCITVKKPSEDYLLEIIDQIKDEQPLTEQVSLFRELIYSCTPMFKEKELQETYDCVEPIDIVKKLIDTMETVDIANQIFEMCGMKDINNTIKN